MRFISVFCLVLAVLYSVYCKNNVKATQSMGQEVIEISAPVKELPPELEEEPSAEVDDDEKPSSIAATIMPVTKKEVKKTSVETRRKAKDPDVNEEEEARIEKELSEIYKDNADYKDTSEEPKSQTNSTSKPALRVGFKFQPDLNNQKEVERFRTSVDDINCAKSVTKLDPRGGERDPKTNGVAITSAKILYIMCNLLAIKLC
ncbi:hypothetical protein NE865_10388 [Phthorimaea operculella]|nr:hypothetical protein NE865_10388 [Phthorimaea operculella]